MQILASLDWHKTRNVSSSWDFVATVGFPVNYINNCRSFVPWGLVWPNFLFTPVLCQAIFSYFHSISTVTTTATSPRISSSLHYGRFRQLGRKHQLPDIFTSLKDLETTPKEPEQLVAITPTEWFLGIVTPS